MRGNEQTLTINVRQHAAAAGLEHQCLSKISLMRTHGRQSLPHLGITSAVSFNLPDLLIQVRFDV